MPGLLRERIRHRYAAAMICRYASPMPRTRPLPRRRYATFVAFADAERAADALPTRESSGDATTTRPRDVCPMLPMMAILPLFVADATLY